jgi:threonyl-tRNA synthetase
MVHRSLVGSMERLFAHLIEVHGGAFPPWYSPVHLIAVPVSPAEEPAARRFVADCVAAGLRAEVAWDGSMGARIRSAAARKVPYVAVIGAREAPHGEVALRLRDGRQLPAMAGAEAVDMICGIVAARSHDLVKEAGVVS